ncbi:MAG TPA: M20 family metallopeptidase [Candidatus Aminicenantes bacterium]|nr:M20 family metallopeptidase [Candidatus Aminicenantes bacterium]HRY65437.1 M20 family metallopeptidase [Candidatus Aminicenantes bacterium]HRZ72095.1 M20 family metallopeptidase [Candidatus Aminicenantes bacterium]
MDIKARIAKAVEDRRDAILGLSRRIHADPELAFEEVRTSSLLRSLLAAEGFEISPATGALPTSFRAVHPPAGAGPRVTFTAEMDALPGLGHACGHNIIGTAGAYAAVVLKDALDGSPAGTIEVVATPAEERGSGKVRLIRDGVFAGTDAVLQIHPHMLDTVVCQALARRTLVVEFFGKKAHAAAAPREGRNALDALVLFYHAAALPRSKFPPGTLFHGVIEAGGEAPNIIPDHTRGRFSLRADSMAGLERLVREARDQAEKAAAETGCRVSITEPGPGVTTFRRNRVLEDLFAGLFEERGRSEPRQVRDSYGSTDLANVSWVVPTIEPMIKASDFPIHTEGFARDAVGPGGERALLDGVYVLAAAAARLLADPALLESVRADFRAGNDDAPGEAV